MSKGIKTAVVIAMLVSTMGATANADTKVDCGKLTICTVVIKK